MACYFIMLILSVPLVKALHGYHQNKAIPGQERTGNTG